MAGSSGCRCPVTRNLKFLSGQTLGSELSLSRCRDCQTTSKTFTVLIDQGDSADGEAMKLGEFPPFSAPISSRIQKLLSESDLELYRKGVRAEAQGLGIGAATYFRRIVEEQWQRLVTEIRQAAVQLGVAVRWYRMAAEQGTASAQYTLGLMYAIGSGVLKDATLAHMWLNIAGANGSEIAREWRDTIEDDMTATQIARATELARTCMDSGYENCEG